MESVLRDKTQKIKNAKSPQKASGSSKRKLPEELQAGPQPKGEKIEKAGDTNLKQSGTSKSEEAKAASNKDSSNVDLVSGVESPVKSTGTLKRKLPKESKDEEVSPSKGSSASLKRKLKEKSKEEQQVEASSSRSGSKDDLTPKATDAQVNLTGSLKRKLKEKSQDEQQVEASSSRSGSKDDLTPKATDAQENLTGSLKKKLKGTSKEEQQVEASSSKSGNNDDCGPKVKDDESSEPLRKSLEPEIYEGLRAQAAKAMKNESDDTDNLASTSKAAKLSVPLSKEKEPKTYEELRAQEAEAMKNKNKNIDTDTTTTVTSPQLPKSPGSKSLKKEIEQKKNEKPPTDSQDRNRITRLGGPGSSGESVKTSSSSDSQSTVVDVNAKKALESESGDVVYDGNKERKTSRKSHMLVPPPELRSFKLIPIFIVEYHNDVVEFLQRCFGSRHLPICGNTLIHFDSHPDMVISKNILPDDCLNKAALKPKLSIENWIPPLLYAGHFTDVVWIKNSWCRQIPTGHHRFKIGRNKNHICVDCPLDYFLSDSSYSAPINMIEAYSIDFRVYDFDTTYVDPNDFVFNDPKEKYVLDIDLDFFSTENPFKNLFPRVCCYERLTEIFYFEPTRHPQDPSNYEKICTKRSIYLKTLKLIFKHLQKYQCLHTLPRPNPKIVSDSIFQKIQDLVQSIKASPHRHQIDWLLLYDAGTTTDGWGLPDHKSTLLDMLEYLHRFKQFLLRLAKPPAVVTIAHSAVDEYCPTSQVVFLEQRVLHILEEVFRDKISARPILYHRGDTFEMSTL